MRTSPTIPQTAILATSSPSDLVEGETFAFSSLLTVSEVATYLRVSEMTVYRMITNREIAATKVGRVWRILAEDLADYLDGHRVPRAS